jgi:hypothetical protein
LNNSPVLEKGAMSEVSFNSLLQQALTLGARKVTRSQFPQYAGFIVYVGLVGTVWAGFSFHLDQGVIVAGISLLLLAAIMAILLLLGAAISPIVLNLLVILVVLGFLGTACYTIVELTLSTPDEMDLRANLEYSDGSSAGDFAVHLKGYQTAVTTSPTDGYFELPFFKEDVHDRQVQLHIESKDSQHVEEIPVTVKLAPVTKAVVRLTIPRPNSLSSPPPLGQPVQRPQTVSTSSGITLQPQDTAKEAKFNFILASDYVRAGNQEGVITALRRAAQLSPTDAHTHECLAVALISTQLDFAGAIDEFRLAVQAGGGPNVERQLSLAIANKDKVDHYLKSEQPWPQQKHLEFSEYLRGLSTIGTYAPSRRECDKAFPPDVAVKTNVIPYCQLNELSDLRPPADDGCPLK